MVSMAATTMRKLAALDDENCRLVKMAALLARRGDRAAAQLALHTAVWRALEFQNKRSSSAA